MLKLEQIVTLYTKNVIQEIGHINIYVTEYQNEKI